MKFYLTLFSALQSQLGSTQIERTTQTFMTLLTKYLICVSCRWPYVPLGRDCKKLFCLKAVLVHRSLKSECLNCDLIYDVSAFLMHSFLKILILLVKDFATTFKSFLPNIVSFALRQMYPILAPVSFV